MPMTINLDDKHHLDRVQPVLLWLRTQMHDFAEICDSIAAEAGTGISQHNIHALTAQRIAEKAATRLDKAPTFAQLDHDDLSLVRRAFDASEYLSLHHAGTIRSPKVAADLAAFVSGMRPCDGPVARQSAFHAYFETTATLLHALFYEEHDRLYTAASDKKEIAAIMKIGLRVDDASGGYLRHSPALFPNNDKTLIAAMGGESAMKYREDMIFEVDTRGVRTFRYPFRPDNGLVRHVLNDIPASRIRTVGRFDCDRGYVAADDDEAFSPRP